MLQIFALACSADQILFCFYKMLKRSGKPSEQIVKRSFNIQFPAVLVSNTSFFMP